MFEQIQQSSATAARRRIYFKIFDATDAVSGKVITTTGVKMRLSQDGAASAASTNDIVAVDPTNEPGRHYIELTAAEAGTVGQIVAELPKSVPNGYLAASAQATIVAYDPYADGASVSTIAAGVRTNLTTELADIVATNATVTSALDATMTSRASQSSLNAGVTLTAGERTATSAAILGTVVETNGGVSFTFKQVLQIIGAFVVGKISGITAGTGTQTTLVRSMTDSQTALTYTDDDLGQRTNVVVTTP